MSLENNHLRLVLCQGDQTTIRIGDPVFRTNAWLQTKVGYYLLGSVVSPLGTVLNEEDYRPADLAFQAITFGGYVRMFPDIPTIIQRASVTRPFLTGVTVIDSFIPIGCGQRELIIGDHNSGKTSLALTAILNQHRIVNGYYKVWRSFEDSIQAKDRAGITYTPCIFVAIGKKRSEIVRIKRVLLSHGAFNYTSIVFTSSDDLVALQYLAPYSGCTMAEFFRDRGMHSVVVYDDLSNHAVAFRQISLLLRRPPGREAYPGDIFYIHARLLERAAQLTKRLGGGSVTALPIVETKGGDVSGYIPTNIISITDGQIFLSMSLANKGILPAIDITQSVSRVGSKAQYNAMKDIMKKVKRDYALYRNYEAFSKIGNGVDGAIKGYVTRGLQYMFLFKQRLYETHTFYRQVISLFAVSNGYLESVDLANIQFFFSIFFSGNFADQYLSNKEHIILGA